MDTLLIERKACTFCGLTKPLDEFHLRSRETGKRHARCKSCQSAVDRTAYAKDSTRKRATSAAAYQRRYEVNRPLVDAVKAKPCADCGIQYPPYVMDFDHLSDKEGLVSRMVWHASTEKLLAEIAKCDVVCSNCHRVRTHERRSQI